jgi:hypothetical protein
MTDSDAKLAALLGKPDRPADEAFVDRIMADVELDRRMRASRAANWRLFAGEAAATAAVIACAVLLGGVAGESGLSGLLLLALFGSSLLIVRPLATASS